MNTTPDPINADFERVSARLAAERTAFDIRSELESLYGTHERLFNELERLRKAGDKDELQSLRPAFIALGLAIDLVEQARRVAAE